MELEKKHSGSAAKLLAIEMLAIQPSIRKKELAKQIGVTRQALNKWLSDPMFIDAWYKRYMETAGRELPAVINAIINEAKAGNVQAGRLILEHFGKLDSRVKIQVESPFEKFMKIEAEDAEFVEDEEISNGATDIANQAANLLPAVDSLPQRDSRNNYPGVRKKNELKSLEFATQSAKKKVKEADKQRDWYARRKRAEAVGLELLPPGRSSKAKRDEWWKELERLEIQKFGEVQG